ncbi:MAG: CDP-alcohol phosphatidyltransferase family protein [Planctomycetota bacterium]|nr:CDP-alcohol phosphatidyltransferase family protein [Planctomycetota bacterium]
MDQEHDDATRRPLKSRNLFVFQSIASWMAKCGISPNAISVSSMVFGLAAGGALWATGNFESGPVRLWWLAGAVFIQLRLLANMLDGMVAIESGKKSPIGELFNEAPDRVSDAAILVGAGFAVSSAPWLGWLGAIMALLVAYLRALGVASGAGQAFEGPMAKPQRMFALTLVCLYFATTPTSWHWIHEPTGLGVMAIVLAVIIVGCLVTLFRRWLRITRDLKNRTS